MTISSEKNPLPGRCTVYRNASEEERAMMFQTWARQAKQQEDNDRITGRVEEEEVLQSDDVDSDHTSEISKRDGVRDVNEVEPGNS